jgi:malate dehydrogenase (quinone)
MAAGRTEDAVDVVLVGGGIVSATLGALLNQLMPDLTLQAFERLEGVAIESSQVMNNAGTGHAANCELNYTPQKPDGSIDIAKALSINESFEVSLQFWSHLVQKGALPDPRAFLNRVPHVSFVWGDKNVDFLRNRHARLSAHPMFADMVLTEDPARMQEWMPLVMEQRVGGLPLAATCVARGTDIDFGVLARLLFDGLEKGGQFQMNLSHHVQALHRDPDGGWRIRVRDRVAGKSRWVRSRFVFLGAGGGALPLLLKSGIPESRGYGGFPVSGQWLGCNNPDIIARHKAKVYGKASLGAPPMSVPHLDTRIWNGRPALLFGPYAGFTTKYLKQGSYLDLPKALRFSNLGTMLAVARDNMDLTKYLIGQVMQSADERLAALREYMPSARMEDWRLEVAGQRVQIMKPDPKRGGRLEFGTEVVTAADGSLAALLGASPGASTAARTMVELIHWCFPERAKEDAFQANLRAMIPSHGHKLAQEPDVLRSVRDRTNAVLGLSV